MTPTAEKTFIAFRGTTCIARGPLVDVAAAARAAGDEPAADAAVLVFDAETSEAVDLDLRGGVEDVRARYAPATPASETPRAPGRPKLGVVAREVTLLPRHWEWLAAQPGGASVTLRKVVETAMRAGVDDGRVRAAQDATYRFATALAGDEAGYEEAIRALYAGDASRFGECTAKWPADARAHARELAAPVFSAGR